MMSGVSEIYNKNDKTYKTAGCSVSSASKQKNNEQKKNRGADFFVSFIMFMVKLFLEELRGDLGVKMAFNFSLNFAKTIRNGNNKKHFYVNGI